VSPLPRLAGTAGVARACPRCGARPLPQARCAECRREEVWEGRAGAACAACGHHGSRVRVIAGRDWLGDDDRGRRGP